jgi:DNA-binding GntR family transcriptional regulator
VTAGGKAPGPINHGTGRRAAGAEIYERLKRDILTFNFRPGERLVELELCDRYEVSRTPVREALRRLEDDGLVIARDRGGRVVKGHDISDYEDVYAIRSVLEVYAVRQLSERASQLDIDALENDWRAGYPAETTPLDGSFVVADERFHLGLAKATGNAYLVESLERVHDRLRTIRSVDFTVRERLIVSAQQHIAITEAIRAGDSDQAAALMEAHIAQSKDEIRSIMLRILSRAYSGRS